LSLTKAFVIKVLRVQLQQDNLLSGYNVNNSGRGYSLAWGHIEKKTERDFPEWWKIFLDLNAI
jgi:hypothetical protein